MVATVVEEHRRAFGAWLREQRRGSEISLREAATRLGMCAAKLSRIETGGHARVRSDATLRAFAALYAVPVEEVYVQAGLHVDPEALAEARAATNPFRPETVRQRAVTLDAAEDVADALNALVAEGWRLLGVIALPPAADVRVAGAAGRVLALMER